MKKPSTILFDLDGTLLNTIEDLTDSTNVILARHQMPGYTVPEIQGFVGNGIRRLIECAVPGGTEHPQFEQIFDEFQAYYTDHCELKTAPYPGIPELLSELKARSMPMAIITNKNQAAVDALRVRFFSQVPMAFGDRPGIPRKPAPDGCFEALNALNASADDAIYVGDSEVDAETARRAGLSFVLCSWGFRTRAQLEALEPLAILDQPSDLLKLL